MPDPDGQLQVQVLVIEVKRSLTTAGFPVTQSQQQLAGLGGEQAAGEVGPDRAGPRVPVVIGRGPQRSVNAARRTESKSQVTETFGNGECPSLPMVRPDLSTPDQPVAPQPGAKVPLVWQARGVGSEKLPVILTLRPTGVSIGAIDRPHCRPGRRRGPPIRSSNG